MNLVDRRRFLSISALGGASVLTSRLFADPPQDANEPVFRAAKLEAVAAGAAHPLDPAIQFAFDTLRYVQENVVDYTAIMIKRERISGVLGDHEFMGVKIRNRKVSGGAVVTPFSVYMTFLKPAEFKGREVIYVENQNRGNIVAHEGGVKGKFIPTMELDPHGLIAMRNQRYPITDVGIENLCIKLIEKGQRDRVHAECTVESKPVKNGDRPATLISVTHPVERPHFDFHRAEIYVDEQLKVPVRYAAYVWPKSPGGEPELLEEYIYQNIKMNVGLKDIDFDRKNPKYNF